MTRGEHRVSNPVGSADKVPSGPPARRGRIRQILAIWITLAMLAAAGGGVAGMSTTQALYTSTAQAQVNTITAGTWAPTGTVPAGCSGKYDFSIKTSSVDFELKLRSNSIVYIDSTGHFDFKNYTHLCLVITVWGFTVVNLDISFFFDFSLLSGWLCFAIHTSSTCGSVGSGSGSGGGGSGGSKHHGFGLMALAAPATQSSPSFADQVQDKVASGQVTAFTVEAMPDSGETSTAPTKTDDPTPTSDVPAPAGRAEASDTSAVAAPGNESPPTTEASSANPTGTPTTTPAASPPTGESSATETAAAKSTSAGAGS